MSLKYEPGVQVYRSKFIFGDLIENIDPTAADDKVTNTRNS